MATQKKSTRRPLSELTNLTIFSPSLDFGENLEKSCSSIGSSMPQIHDGVVESQDTRKELVNITQAVGKPKQINKRKARKASRYARAPGCAPRQYIKKEWSQKSLVDYIEKQRAYYAEIDAFELTEEEV